MGGVTALLLAAVLGHPGLTAELKEASQALEASPEDVPLLVARADIARRAGAYNDALADLDRAECLDPNLPDVWLARGLTRYDMDQLGRARVALDRYLEVASSVHGHWARARLRARAGDVDGATADFDAALAAGPSVDIALERAQVLRRAGRLDAAATGLQRALTDTGSDVVRAELCALHLERSRPDDARALADEALARTRVRAPWLLLRARAHELAGRDANALSDRLAALTESRSLVRRRPGPLADKRLARAFLALGRYRDATDVLTADPDARDDPERAELLRRARQRGRR